MEKCNECNPCEETKCLGCSHYHTTECVTLEDQFGTQPTGTNLTTTLAYIWTLLQSGTGVAGDDGVGVQGATINGSGNLIITLTDGTIIDAGTVVGTDGTEGSAGDKGEVGGFTIEYNNTVFNASPYSNVNNVIQTTATGYTQVGSHEWWFSDYDAYSNDISYTVGTFYDAIVAESYDKIYIKIFDTTDSSKMQIYEATGATVVNSGNLRIDMTRLGGNNSWDTSVNKIGVSFSFVKKGNTGSELLYNYNIPQQPTGDEFGASTSNINAWTTIQNFVLPHDIPAGDYLDIDIKILTKGTISEGKQSDLFRVIQDEDIICNLHSSSGELELVAMSGFQSPNDQKPRTYNINLKLLN